MTLLTLIACTSTDTTFLGGSGRFEPTKFGDTGDTSAADSGDTGGSGSSTGDEGAPVLTAVEVHWEEYPDYGVVLEFSASFTDEGDDVLGGTCFLDLFSGGDFVDDYALTASDDPEDNGGQVCVVTGAELTFAIPSLDDTEAAGIDIVVRDSSGNDSAVYTAEVDGQ